MGNQGTSVSDQKIRNTCAMGRNTVSEGVPNVLVQSGCSHGI